MFNYTNQDWNEDQIEALRAGVELGHSFSIIGRRINKTRNACIGKARRMDFKTPEDVRKTRAPRIVRSVPKKSPTLSVVPKKPPAFVDDADVPEMPSIAETVRKIRRKAVRGAMASLMARDATQCHWPIGDPKKPDFHYCDADQRAGLSNYCDQHHKQATDQRKTLEDREQWAKDNKDLPSARRVLDALRAKRMRGTVNG